MWATKAPSRREVISTQKVGKDLIWRLFTLLQIIFLPSFLLFFLPSFLSVGNTNSDLLSLSKTRCHQSQFLQNDLLALLGYTPLVAKMPFTVSDHRSSRVCVVCIFDLVLQRTAEKIPQCLCPKVHCCVLGWKGWGQEGWEQSFQNPLRFLQP